MSSLPRSLQKTIDFFEKLPGIGPKSARRLGFYLLRLPTDDLKEFAENVSQLKEQSLYCNICFNLTEKEVCSICLDTSRNQEQITVVEDVLDLLSMENGQRYKGVYHVLHGRIDPLNYVGPEDLKIAALVKRVDENPTEEIILATNPTVEGEATAMFIKKRLNEAQEISSKQFKITRIAYGLPIGADLEYADYMTLQKAMEGRREL